MPRTAAAITQADVARAIRAAKQAGAAGVEIDGGKIRILLTAPEAVKSPSLDDSPHIVL